MTQPSPESRWMSRAIALSKRGFPAPNPHVGCVLVKDDTIVGEGFHDHAGGPHAEVVALRAAGNRAQGAVAFVTLEPCNHHGRTPPCSEALIEAGVSKVFVAVKDSNPRAKGGGAHLMEAGIPVEFGLLEDRAREASRLFHESIRLNRPYVIVKSATSLDGRIALPSGESKWITGPKARASGQRLRAECGAVLVGRKTVELDDPQLTARIPGVVNQPLRIVLDPGNRLDGRYRVFSSDAETWHITGHIDLQNLLVRLYESGRTGLLVEGGAFTIGTFMKEDRIDEIRLFVAPKVFGHGPDWISEFHIDSLQESPRFEFQRPKIVGGDTELSARRIRPKL